MSRPAFTVHIFSIYLLGLGIGLALFPNLLLSLFGVALTSEIWIRVVGILAFNIGVFCWYAAASESLVAASEYKLATAPTIGTPAFRH